MHTSQNIFRYINKRTENRRLMSNRLQRKYTKTFFSHFFYPWKKHINYVTVDFLRRYVVRESGYFSRHLGYAENYQRHTSDWFKRILKNVNVSKFPNRDQRAIAIENAYIRMFPTMISHFSRQDEASSGYPFDDFQLSVLWAGTPVRILQRSQDGAWEFVMTPSVSGWVKSNTLAKVDNRFVTQWKTSKFVALTIRRFSVIDVHGIYRFDAYMGSLFPYTLAAKSNYVTMVPVRDINGQARYSYVSLPKDIAKPIPWLPTAKNFAFVIRQFLGTHYGWGGVYFYGDCSSSLKSIFTPFGIWLPRNSQAQAHSTKQMPLKKFDPVARKAAILKYGKPFTTLISMKGHIMLYVGKYKGEVMTFQNVWAFATMSRTGKAGRDIIGSAVLLPLKLSFGNSGMFPQIDGENLAMTFLAGR